MKSKIHITSLLALTIFISSCGTLSVSRMRYTKGLNINFSRNESAKEENKAKLAHKNQQPTQKNLSTAVSQDESNKTTITSGADLNSSSNSLFSEKLTKDDYTVSGIAPQSPVSKQGKETVKIKTVVKEIKQKYIKRANASFPGKNETHDSDVALLLLVILAILIPPLAVFLYYGEINTQFWISLILTLLAAGAFGLGIALGWGVPVIHALLVIFGIFG